MHHYVEMPVIRSYRATDRSDIYDVCLRTAAGGGDATGVYSNDDLMPDIFALPYVDFEPELAFVVDTGARASGYVIATANTRDYVDRYHREWLPRLAQKYRHVQPPLTAEDEIVHLGFWPKRMLIPEVDEYPAHLHIDILPELQGQGLGRKLIGTLVGALGACGIRNLHLTMDPANTAARAFYNRLGFVELPSSTPMAPVFGI